MTKAPSALAKTTIKEINRLARSAPTHRIIQGVNYLYFSLQPTQEEIKLKTLCTKPNLRCYSVLNFKGSIIGYVVQFGKKPVDLNIDALGVAIYYSKSGECPTYKKLSIPFFDSKFRVLLLDSKDYFVSVKWRSNNPTE